MIELMGEFKTPNYPLGGTTEKFIQKPFVRSYQMPGYRLVIRGMVVCSIRRNVM